MRVTAGILAAGAAIAVAGACASMGGGADLCSPTTGRLGAGVTLAPLAGRFIVTMVATAGPERGQTVAGYLTLRRAQAHPRFAFIGGTDLRLETVGALRLGDTGAEDPEAPGIGVIEQRPAGAAPTVTARIGSVITSAPIPGLMQIEGSYTVLFVRRVDGGGFGGGWSSGDGTPGNRAEGYFCARRVE